MGKEVEIHFDLETTARGTDNSPEAHFQKNKVVMAGWCENGREICTTNSIVSFLNYIRTVHDRGDTPVLIAHNLKFDLKYLLRFGPDIPWERFKYHDTMTAHYRASGHKSKFISLEKLCEKFKIKFKKGLDLGALILAGVDVDDIDKDDLKEYLKGDVHALHQVDFAMQRNNSTRDLDLDYILPLARMELNGLPLDIPKTQELARKLEKEKITREQEVVSVICHHMEWGDGKPVTPGEFKPLAPRTLSYFLTGFPTHGCGGGAKAKPKDQLVFKNGKQPAFDKYTIERIFSGAKLNPNLGYPMNASVLEEICNLSATAKSYKQAKDNNKLLNTYIFPFLAEAAQTDGTVHPKLNTCSTNTGRLSSSSPNGQNIPPIIRHLIKSTLGEMYEIDFAQLEMIGAATLSGDAVMIDDIRGGRDIHYETGRTVMGWHSPSDMTKDTRRTVKAVNFGLLYGGGAAGIAASSGVDKKTVKALIDSFYARYPDVAKWQDLVLEDVKSASWVEGHKDGESFKGSTYTLPLQHGGRVFYFEESASPFWMKAQQGKSYSFKPTETKNYPIQGFAGGDIVMKALTILDDVLAGTSAVMRMTVHDSIVVDWAAGKETDLHNIMGKVCGIVGTTLGIPVPLMFDVEHDIHWL